MRHVKNVAKADPATFVTQAMPVAGNRAELSITIINNYIPDRHAEPTSASLAFSPYTINYHNKNCMKYPLIAEGDNQQLLSVKKIKPVDNLINKTANNNTMKFNFYPTGFSLLRGKFSFIFLLAIALIAGNSLSAQTNFFTAESAGNVTGARVAANQVNNKGIFRLDESSLRTYLQAAPMEFRNNGQSLPLQIPLPNGTTETFNIVESPILSPAMAAAHPEIKTYTGNGTNNKKAVVRLSLTSNGFNAVILNVQGDAVYFEKYATNVRDVYFNYFTREAIVPRTLEAPHRLCGVLPGNNENQRMSSPVMRSGLQTLSSGATLRTYRLAFAATGEFTGKHGGTAASSFADIVAYVNRMTAVYRNELSVNFTLVSGTNLIYTNSATDPYTGDNELTMLNENQNNVDAVIGNANYDIAHVLSWNINYGSGGGVAASPSLGVDGQKARGASIEGEVPYVQLFFDQLVFHEVGHMFSMSHSYNSNIPVCTTRNQPTSAEPGSGATIMSYGFTCGTDDYGPGVTQGPILNFHTVNYDQAVTYMSTIPAIGTVTSTGNTPPVVTVPGAYTIPKSTPFALTGNATDANGDALTYQWEGTNVGLVTVPDATVLADPSKPPFFRSYEPSPAGATRTYPVLSAILDGSNYAIGDKLPSASFATTNRLIVRDNNAAGGGVSYGDVTVTVDGNTGPFLETTNLSGSYAGGSSQTITWSVNGTNVATPNVKISLSTDGGLTFPTVLLASTPNDGTQTITLPNTATTTARIKVEAVGNIFFDISNVNFTITLANPTVNLSVSTNAGSEAAATVVTVTATASSAVSGAQTVALGVSGTGITTGDYTLSNTTITIPDGATTGTVTFTVVDDALVEGTETAILTINSPSAGITLGATTTQNIVITDNDIAPSPTQFYVNDNTTAGDVYTTAIGNDANPGTAALPFATIQHAISVAQAGNKIYVDAGTYIENVIVNKQLQILGAQNAFFAPATFINTSTIGGNAITIAADGVAPGGTGLSMEIQNIHCTGKTTDILNNNDYGINVTVPAYYLNLYNVYADNYRYAGLIFNGTYSAATAAQINVWDCQFQACDLGINLNLGMNGIYIKNGLIKNNRYSGLITAGSDAGILTNITVEGTQFVDNGTGGLALSTFASDIFMQRFNGNGLFKNLTFNTYAATALDLRGKGPLGTPAGAAGTVQIQNCTFTGHALDGNAYNKDLIKIRNFTDISTISFTGVTVNTRDDQAATGLRFESDNGPATYTLSGISFPNASSGIGHGFDIFNTTALNVNATTGVSFGTATNFQVEDRILHKIDYAALGLVTWVANNNFVTTNSYYPPATTATSIQRGIDAASNGFTVNVAAGTYTENININKEVTLNGAGYTTKINSVTTNGNIITVAANNVTVSNMHLEGTPISGSSATRGIYFNSAVSGIAISDLKSSIHQYAVYMDNSAVVTGLTVTNTELLSSGNGFQVEAQAKVSNLSISGGSISNNLYGLSSTANSAATNNQTGLTGVTVTGTTFSGNTTKGAYFEKLNNANFSNNTFTGNGTDPSFPSGIDINLKYGTYTGITFTGNSLSANGSGNATTGTAITVKGRNDAPNYNTNPASLTTLSITNNDITGSPAGLTIGNNVIRSSATITNNAISSCGAAFVSTGAPAGSTTTVSKNGFTSYAVYSVLNTDANSNVAATCNWFGTTNAATIAAGIAGTNITYTPTLTHGDEQTGVRGFQTTEACSACNLAVTVDAGSPVNVTCHGGNTGSINVTVTGGSGSYSYAWTGTGAYTNTTEDIATLVAGTYNLTVTDITSGCTATISGITITEPATVAVSGIITNATCNGTSTGSVDITVTGGSGSYTYLWSNSATTQDITNVAAATYTVIVTESNGCTVTGVVSYTVGQPAVVATPTATLTQPTCLIPSGTITINTPVPATGITYKVTGPSPATTFVTNATGVFAGLAPGVYSVTTTNATGCTSSPLSQTINAIPTAPAIPTATLIQPTCTVTTGTITVTLPVNGTGITYTVTGPSPATTVVTNSSGVFAGLAPGVYAVTTSNTTTGCTSSPLPATINAIPTAPAIPTATLTQPTCLTPSGTITVTLPVNGAGITYTVTGPSPATTAVTNSSGLFAGLAPGVYAVTTSNTITGCTSLPLSATINAAPALPATPTATLIQPTCAIPTGTITVDNPTPATTYKVTGPSPATTVASNLTGIFPGLAPGVYSLTATNAGGCTSLSLPVTINAAPALPATPTATLTQTTCILSTGTITVTSPANGPGITYTITGPSPATTVLTNGTGSFPGLVPGTYSVTTTNATGCASLPLPATINAQPLIVPTFTQVAPICLQNAPTSSPRIFVRMNDVTPGNGGVVLGQPWNNISISNNVNLKDEDNNTTNVGLAFNTVFIGAPYAGGPTTGNNSGVYPDAVLHEFYYFGYQGFGFPTPTTVDGSFTHLDPSKKYKITFYAGSVFTFGGDSPITPENTGTTTYTIGANTVSLAPFGNTTNTVSLSNLVPDANGVITFTMNKGPNSVIGYLNALVLSPDFGLPASSNNSTPITGSWSPAFDGTTPGTTLYTFTPDAGQCAATTTMSVTVNAYVTPSFTQVGPLCQNATVPAALPTSSNNPTPITGTWSPVFSTAVLGPTTYTFTPDAGQCASTATMTVNIVANPTTPVVALIQPTCSTPTGTITVTAPTTGITSYTVTGTNPIAAPVTQPGAVFAGLAPGTYSVTATNAAGCTAVLTGVVINTAPGTPATPTADLIQPNCNTTTGTITITSPIGLTSYTVTGITPAVPAVTQAGLVFAGLAPGLYSVTATNSTGCTSLPLSVTINAAPGTPTTPAATLTQPTCSLATGTITITSPTTGITSYTVTGITPAVPAVTQAGLIFAGLAPGTYSVTATNAGGCTSSAANFTINAQPATPTTAVVGTITQPSCAAPTGTVILTGLPATGTWTINPGAITGTGTSKTITGLTPGTTYNFTVTNAAGCISVASADVVINTVPAAPTTPTAGTITQPSCAAPTGTVILNGLPASGTWTINPGNISGTGTSKTITGLTPGTTYNFTVTNAVGCTSSSSANVVISAVPGAPTAPAVGTITQPTCLVSTGSVILNGLPATGTWTINPGNITGTGTSTTISNLAANTYNYTVTNAAGCTSVSSADIVINAQPATPTAPVVGTITQPACATPTGSVILTGLPATGTWTINPGNISGTGTNKTITGLTPGNTYNFTVTNAAGCISVASADVVINAVPAAPTTPTVGTITQPTCASPTGSVILNGLPASGTWTINPGAITGTGTSKTITGIVAGITYNFTVTNAVGCTSSPSADVVINAAPATPTTPAVGTITQPTCTTPTGSVILSGLPATGTWTINPGAITGTGSSKTVTGLTPGLTYNFTVTNAAGCNSLPSADVAISTVPVAPAAPLVGTITQPSCATPTGSVILSGLPATGTWTINPGAITGTGTSTTLTGLIANTTYNFTVTNTTTGCTSSPSADVVINAAPTTPATPVVTLTQPTCSVTTGTITITTPTGLTSYTVTGTNPVTTPVTQAGLTFAGLAPGTYNVTATNAAGCTSLPLSVTLNSLTLITPTFAAIGPLYQNTAAPVLPLTSINGITGTWSPAAISTASLGSSSYLFTPAAGQCGTTASLTVLIIPIVSDGKTIPGRIEAEAWDTKSGFQYQVATTDVGGGFKMVGISNGSWMDYNVNVLSTGSYTVGFRVATTQSFAQFQIKLGATVLATVSLPSTGGWDIWHTYTIANVPLTAGNQTLRIQSTNNENCDFNWMEYALAGNQPPTANAGANQTIILPVSQTTLNGSGTDPESGLLTYAWSQTGGTAATITSASSATTTITGLTTTGVRTFRLTVTDDHGATATSDVTVTVSNPGPPTVNAGTNQTIILPVSQTSLSGIGAAGNGGGTITYAWTRVSGPNNIPVLNIATPASATTLVTGLVQGVYVFRLTVTQTDNQTAFSEVTVTVSNPGPPTANAGISQTIQLPLSQATLTGSGTSGNGGPISYGWAEISGPNVSPALAIVSPASATTLVTGLVQGVYVFRLTVTQNDNQTATSDITITVNPVVVSNGKTIPGRIEAEAWDTKSGFQYQVATTDVGGGFKMVGISNGSWMDYNVNVLSTGSYTVGFRVATTQSFAQFQIKLGATVLATVSLPSTGGWDIWHTYTIANVPLTAGNQTLRIQSTNNENCDFNWMEYALAGNQPPTANAGANQTIILPVSQTTLNGSGTDPESGLLTYAWSQTGGTAATITSASSATTTITGLTTTGVRTFRLTVTDDHGATATSDVTVTVSNPGPPTVNAGTNQTIILPVSQTSLSGIGAAGNGGGTITYAWTRVSGPNNIPVLNIATPASATTLVTGLVQGVYVFRLTVTQTDNQTAFSEVTVTVSNPGPPTANAGISQTIQLPLSQATLTGSGTSGNGGPISYGWAEISGPNVSPALAIVSPASATTLVTGLVQGVYVFRLTVTQNDNQTATSDITITVNAASNGKTIPGRIEAEARDAQSSYQYAVATTDVGGGFKMVGISNGSSMDYNVNVLQSGLYTVGFRVATTQSNAHFQIKLGATVLATVALPSTGGWDNWVTYTVSNVPLTAGTQTLRILSTNNENCDFNWMEYSFVSAATGNVTNLVAGKSSAPENNMITPAMAQKQKPVSDETVDTQNASTVELFPNPIHDQFIIKVNNEYAGVMKIQIISQAGRIMKEVQANKNKGTNQVPLSANGLPDGLYVIRIQMGDSVKSVKMIKL